MNEQTSKTYKQNERANNSRLNGHVIYLSAQVHEVLQHQQYTDI